MDDEKTLDEIKTELAHLWAESGSKQYQIYIMNQEISKMNTKIQNLNHMGYRLLKEEEETKKRASDAAEVTL